jgi:hypothetical protein
MTALEELRADDTRKVAARFFLRIGQAGRAEQPRDEATLPLFGLPLILEAEGLLAKDYAYLSRCEALIRAAAMELAA